MPTATTTGAAGQPAPLSGLDVLGDDPEALRAALEGALDQDEVRRALPAGITGAAAGFVVAQAATALDSLLGDLRLGDILMGAWGSLSELQHVIDETLADGSVRTLTIASHTVTSEHHPSLELVVNQAPSQLMQLVITLGLTVDACDLVVDAGQVTGAQVGSLRAGGEIGAHGATVLSKETTDLDPKRLFGVRSGAGGAGAAQ